MTIIFVGHLASNRTPDELRRLFQRYGSVEGIEIMTDPETGYSSGFAFVEMTNAHEAGRAISHLHGTIVWEQPIQVEESGPRLVPSIGQLERQNRA